MITGGYSARHGDVVVTISTPDLDATGGFEPYRKFTTSVEYSHDGRRWVKIDPAPPMDATITLSEVRLAERTPRRQEPRLDPRRNDAPRSLRRRW